MESQYRYLPDDQNYYLAPQTGEPVILVINEGLVETYQELGESWDDSPKGPNYSEAKRLRKLLERESEIEVEATVKEYYDAVYVTLEGGEEVTLLASHESMLNAQVMVGGELTESGLIPITHFKGLKEWDPREHRVVSEF